MKKLIVALTAFFTVSISQAIVMIDTSDLPNGINNPESPSVLQVSKGRTQTGAKALVLVYTLAGDPRNIYLTEGALKDSGYSINEFESKVLAAINAGDNQVLTITAISGTQGPTASSYYVETFASSTLAASPRD